MSTDSLTPKLIKTELAQYDMQAWPGSNESGYRPIGDMVLVMIDKIALVSRGGIHIPEDVADKMNLAAETGVLAAMGDGAFRWSADRRRPFGGEPPRIGDHVYLERYGGQLINGDDGRKYRLLPDRQIGAIKE